jgi:hypothetical protein
LLVIIQIKEMYLFTCLHILKKYGLNKTNGGRNISQTPPHQPN